MVKKSVVFLVMMLLLLSSCSDRIDKRDMYTFTDITVADYIRSCPQLSTFARLMDMSQLSDRTQSTVGSLLGVYGNYTVFAPTNEAIKEYLDAYYGTDCYEVDTLPQEVLRKLVNTCVVDMGKGNALRMNSVREGYLSKATINGVHLYFGFGDYGNGATVSISELSHLIKTDILTCNGYVNIIDHVIQPGPSTLPGLIAQTDNLSIFSRLLDVTSWADSMLVYSDDKYQGSAGYGYRLLHFTAFVETDSVFEADWNVPAPQWDEDGNMTNWNDILDVIRKHCVELSPEATDADMTSSDNAVNRFVSYHLLPFWGNYSEWSTLKGEYGTNRYLYDKGLGKYPAMGGNPPSHAVFYYQTMGKPNRLVQLTYLPQPDKEGVYINRHSLYDPSYGGDWQELSCDRRGVLVLPDNGNRQQHAPNGIYYPIDHVMTYDSDVPNKVLNTRLRYNPIMNLPELMTLQSLSRLDSYYPVPDQLTTNISTANMNLYEAKGSYASTTVEYRQFRLTPSIAAIGDKVTVKLLPVPYEGEWEVRISDLNGIYHCFIGNSPDASMQDLGIKNWIVDYMWLPPKEYNYPHPNNPSRLGFVVPDSTQAMEINKQCREHGIMKLPYGYGYLETIGQAYRSARTYNYVTKWDEGNITSTGTRLRFIVYRGHMSPDQDYWLRLQLLSKSAYGDIWRMNLIELVPRSVYDNPERPEDWW